MKLTNLTSIAYSFTRVNMWQEGLRFPDQNGMMIGKMSRKFMQTMMKITCPVFQAECAEYVESMMQQRLTKLFHNVTSKYRAKIRAMSKF
jgi:hypothetical protein